MGSKHILKRVPPPAPPFPIQCICSHTNKDILSFYLCSNLPKSDKTPQAIHTMRDIPTLPECFRMPFGEMKIPAPMMVPMMIEIPRSRVTFFPSPTFPSSLSSCSFPPASDWVPFWEALCPFAGTLPPFSLDADLLDMFWGNTQTHTQTLSLSWSGLKMWFTWVLSTWSRPGPTQTVWVVQTNWQTGSKT